MPAYSRASEFDILHFHTTCIHYPLQQRNHHPAISTLHGRLDTPGLQALYSTFPNVPIVSISESQRKPIAANWVGNIHHGLPANLYNLTLKPEGYLAFIGRISPDKRVDRAVEIARRCGLPIKIAAKVDPFDKEYFEQEIKPLLDLPFVEYIGEIGESDKNTFLGNALALLFPIDWPEPFGLVMIEAMACGTPVIAFENGSVKEIISDGTTGFIVNSIDEVVMRVRQVSRLSRTVCRKIFETRFTSHRMALDYVNLYRSQIAQNKSMSRESIKARFRKKSYESYEEPVILQ